MQRYLSTPLRKYDHVFARGHRGAVQECSRGLSEHSERYPCAEHVQQLGSESLLSNLMEVKD